MMASNEDTLSHAFDRKATALYRAEDRTFPVARGKRNGALGLTRLTAWSVHEDGLFLPPKFCFPFLFFTQLNPK